MRSKPLELVTYKVSFQIEVEVKFKDLSGERRVDTVMAVAIAYSW